MKPSIFELKPSQLEESAKVIRAAFETVADEFDFTPENNPNHGAFMQADKLLDDYNRGIKMFGLHTGGVQVGFIAVKQKNEALYYFEKLAVLPSYRRHGYGRLLLDHACEYIREAGGGRVSIAVINENTSLKNWYLQYGFVQTSLKDFEHLSFTVCYMTLDIYTNP